MNKAQATLEFTVVFVIMVFLLVGMLSLWKWSSDRMVKRQIDYNASRKEAGTRSSDNSESITEIPQGGDVVIIQREPN